MGKSTTKPISEEIPDLDFDEVTQATIGKVPDLNEDESIILELPDLDLSERRFANGPSAFFSLFPGSKYTKGKGNVKDGVTTDYSDTWHNAGKLFISVKSQRVFLQPLDVVALLEMLKEHKDYFAYQVMRNRADLKEELHKKGKYL